MLEEKVLKENERLDLVKPNLNVNFLAIIKLKNNLKEYIKILSDYF